MVLVVFMDGIFLKPVGVVRSPLKSMAEAPIQPSFGEKVKGTIEVFPEYAEGLEGIEGFYHLIVLFFFHQSKSYSLKVKPFLLDELKGVFATRAPRRPNQIGLSVVRLEKVVGCRLEVSELDILDGAPVLDLKPFVPEFDERGQVKIGWLEGRIEKAKAKPIR